MAPQITALGKRPLLLIGAIVMLLLVIGVIIYAISNPQRPSTGIEFIVVPDEISVNVGDRSFNVSYESTIAFSAGTYSLTLKKEGFETITQSVEVIDKQVTSIYVGLKPLSDAAKELLSSSIMQARLERIGGHRVLQVEKAIEENYSFVNKLPITKKYFTINPCNLVVNDEKIVAICIVLAINNDTYKDQALKALADAGIDASKWVVHFEDPDMSD